MRISVKGLAKFMTSGEAAKRKILKDFKFPNPEGGVQAAYYVEARHAIAQYHNSGNDPAVIVAEVQRLGQKAYRATGGKRTRLEHNMRALQSYLENFGREEFKVLATPSISLRKGDVVVSARPDLFVRHDGREKLIKLDLGTSTPIPRVINITIQVIYDAALSDGIEVLPKDVIYIDVARAEAHLGARVRTRLRTEIQAACQNIEALWPTIN